jgi:molybdopterin biosynthesis enzyme
MGPTERSSPWPMLPMAEAARVVFAAATQLAAHAGQRHTFMPLSQAVGYVMAQDRHATTPLPPFPASIMVNEV